MEQTFATVLRRLWPLGALDVKVTGLAPAKVPRCGFKFHENWGTFYLHGKTLSSEDAHSYVVQANHTHFGCLL